MQANKTFVEMKKDMMETKGALESTVKLHKESLRQQRSIEFEITVYTVYYNSLACVITIS